MNSEQSEKNAMNHYNQILGVVKDNKELTFKQACFIVGVSYNTIYNYRFRNKKLYDDFRQNLSKLKNNDDELKEIIVENYNKMINLAMERKELSTRDILKVLGISYNFMINNKKKFPDIIEPLNDRFKEIRMGNLKEKYEKLKGQKRKEYKKREKVKVVAANKYKKLKKKINEKDIRHMKNSFFLVREALRIENFKQRFFLNCQHSQSIKEIIKRTDETYPFFYKCMLYDKDFALNVKYFLKKNKMFDKFNLSYLDSSI